MKNSDARLYQELKVFSSATRFLITGTPLQNEMKELWSLLHFLLPSVFKDWEAFDSYFDFTGLEDEEETQNFISDEEKQELMRKIHIVLQPLMLRRVKADVASYLPQKREYILYAPLTKEQTDLYKAISDKSVDTREFLHDMVAKGINERSVSQSSTGLLTPQPSRHGSATPAVAGVMVATPGAGNKLPVRLSPRKNKTSSPPEAVKPAATNAFALMMGKKGAAEPKGKRKAAAPPAPPAKAAEEVTDAKKTPASKGKRKVPPVVLEVPEPKSSRSSREGTPASGRRSGRVRTAAKADAFADVDEDQIDDEEFEARLVSEYENQELIKLEEKQSAADFSLANSFDIASKLTYTHFCRPSHGQEAVETNYRVFHEQRKNWPRRSSVTPSCSFGSYATARTTSTILGPMVASQWTKRW